MASISCCVSSKDLRNSSDESGESRQDGHISKQGRRELRRVLIEAAWSAVNTHPYWKREFTRLCRHKPEGVVIVAIARKLLVAIWHVLTERAADCHTEPAMVTSKARWSWQLTPEQCGGLTSRQFVRYGLLRFCGLAMTSPASPTAACRAGWRRWRRSWRSSLTWPGRADREAAPIAYRQPNQVRIASQASFSSVRDVST